MKDQNDVSQIARARTRLVPGDIVFQASRGITGRVVDITTDLEPRVLVQFADGPPQEMSLNLAITALTKLRPDGLQAQAVTNRDTIIAYQKDDPLKLVALALVDLSMIGKPSAIRLQIQRSNLLSVGWETWWKKVQPALKRSSSFRLRSDGAYELLTSPDQISATRLPAVTKKKEVSLTQLQLLELIEKTATGGLRFEDVQGARAKHLVAMELVKRSVKAPQLKRVIFSAFEGPVVAARIVLHEYMKKANTQNALDAIDALLDHLADLMSTAGARESKSTEHVHAKLKLLHDELALTLPRLADRFGPSDLLPINRRLLMFAKGLMSAEDGVRRREATAVILKSLSTIAAIQPQMLNSTLRDLEAMQVQPDVCASVARGMVEAMPGMERDGALRRLIAGALALPVDYPDTLITSLLPRQRCIQWLTENMREILQIADPGACKAISVIAERTGARIGTEETAGYVQLVMAISLANPGGGLSLSQTVRARLAEWASTVSLAEKDESILDEEDALSPLIVAVKARLERERSSWRERESSLQSEIAGFKDKIIECDNTINRLQGVVEELKSGYRMPERWAEYRGKKDTMERLGILYQEILTSGLEDQFAMEASWILRQIEAILIRSGASAFGDIGDTVVFSPSQHEFIQGMDTSERRVKIRCPGFRCKDPAGSSVVLVRARVTRQ